jgi:ABC-2 type transport system permease protein
LRSWRMKRMHLRHLPGLLHLFVCNCKMSLNRGMAYRTDFVLNLLISLVFTSMGPIVQYLIFTQTSGYPGWNTEQILLFQGILLFSMGLNNTNLGEVKSTAVPIMRNGDFDRYLINPFPSIGVLLAGGFSLKHIGTFIAGITITGYMMVRMKLVPGVMDVVLFLWFLAAGIIASIGITILFCGLVIVLIQMGRLAELLENVMRFAGYPLELYKGLSRTVFVTLLPLAVLAYLPAQALLHRFDWSMIWGSFGSVLIFGLSLRFWSRCIRKYTSAGG